MNRSTLHFIYGAPNVTGCILGLVGLLLYFFGIIGPYWLAIVFGLYVAGYFLVPTRKDMTLSIRNRVNAATITRELDGLLLKIQGKVPIEVMQRCRAIRDLIVDALPALEEAKTLSRDAFVIRETALDYLPAALENYLRLPRAYARLHKVRDGKTASELLLEQLTLLEEELERIVADLRDADSSKLVAHGRFLASRFAKADEF